MEKSRLTRLVVEVDGGSLVETVTIAADRGGSILSGTTLTIVSVLVIAIVAFAALKHFRNRDGEPRA